MTNQRQLYVIVGEVTDSEIAEIYSAETGRNIKIGDVEFRVTNDHENPAWSHDYACLRQVWRDFPGAMLVR